MAKQRRNLDHVSMEDDDKQEGKGKRFHQKIKPYVVLQYLLKNSDEEHVISAEAIADCLFLKYKINAEKRSIYSDIKEINAVALMMREECTINEAAQMLEEDKSDDLRMVVYDPHRKGFYVRERAFALDELRLLAECVYAAKFVSRNAAERMIDSIGEFASDYQKEAIQHDVYLADRVKTNNAQVLLNVDKLNRAIQGWRDEEGTRHKPCKVSFQYLKYEINNLKTQVERRHGLPFVASPYKLLISDGNYYLLAYNEQAKKKEIHHYRIDRMRNVILLEEEREGLEKYQKLNVRTYVQRQFGMFKGEEKPVRIRFLFTLLDTMVERFGTNARYKKIDDKFYSLETNVEISEQFYGWVSGFGRRVSLIGDKDVVDGYRAYLDKLRGMYPEKDGQ